MLTLVLVTLVRIDIETAIRPHAIPSESSDLFPRGSGGALGGTHLLCL